MSGTAVRNPNPQSAPNDGAPGAGTSLPQASDTSANSLDREELLKRIILWHNTDRDHWHLWRQEAVRCYDFRAGHQWDEEDLQILRDQTRPAITFNRIGPFVDSVGGLEINNRQETRYSPRQVGASGVNDLLTGAAQWARQECDAEDEETEAFLDAVTCGLGCVQTRMDYDDDPDGMIRQDRINPLEMLPDSNARKQNLSDSQHQMRITDITLAAARELLPDVPDEDLHASWAEDVGDTASDPHNARLAPYYRVDQADKTDRQQHMVRMAEVEWWQYEPAYRVLDPATGRFFMIDAQKASTLKFRARVLGAPVHMLKDRRKRHYKAIVGAVVLKIMDGADRGGFTYKFITGKRDVSKGTWYGLVRAMIDPQMWSNKWLSQGLHILNTNAKGGILAETDAFADIDEARDDWASADSITELNPGGLQKIQQKEPPAFPNQLNLMMSLAIDAIPMVSGINMELMGQSTSTAPQVGMVEVGRKQQGMNVLAALFNAKRRYQKEQGRLLLWMIQEFISDGRLIRIGGPENAQYVPLVHEPGLAEYDVIVEDAPTSPNMKDKVWAALMQMFPLLRGMNIPPAFYVNALKYSPTPASFVQESQKILSQPPPPDPAQKGMEAVAMAQAGLLGAQAQKAGAEAGKIAAETQKAAGEAQMAPQKLALDADEQQARTEKLRADAINALQNAGIIENEARFQDTVKAIDGLLAIHGASLTEAQQTHRQAVEVAQHGLAERDLAHRREMDVAAHELAERQAMQPAPAE